MKPPLRRLFYAWLLSGAAGPSEGVVRARIMPGEQGLKWYVHPFVAPRFGNMSIVLSCGAAGLKCRCRCPKSATDLFGLKRF